MAKVYIPHPSPLDYSEAQGYGEIVFLMEGRFSRFNTSAIYKSFFDALEHSTPQDYFVPSGTATINAIAGFILGLKHGKLRLLLYRDGNYVLREISFEEGGGEYVGQEM